MRLAAGTGVWAHVHVQVECFFFSGMNTTNILCQHPLSVTKVRVITCLLL